MTSLAQSTCREPYSTRASFPGSFPQAYTACCKLGGKDGHEAKTTTPQVQSQRENVTGSNVAIWQQDCNCSSEAEAED